MALTQKEHSAITLTVFLIVATGLVLAVFLPTFLEGDTTFRLREARGAGKCLTLLSCNDSQCGLSMEPCSNLQGSAQVFAYNQRAGLYNPAARMTLREDLQGNAIMVPMGPPDTSIVMMDATDAGFPNAFAFWYSRGREAPVPFTNTFQGKTTGILGADITGAYLVHAAQGGTVSWAASTTELQAPRQSLLYQDFNV